MYAVSGNQPLSRRPLMGATDFERFRIKTYSYWELYLNGNQAYLGRSYVWLKREGKVGLTSLTKYEHSELFQEILPKFEAACAAAFRFDRKIDLMNYAWLCNEESHGHHGYMHAIPRYKNPKVFNGEIFIDKRWGKNYAPYEISGWSEHLVQSIKEKILSCL